MSAVRAIASVLAGALIAAVLYHISAAIALLVTVGIPLGSSGEDPGAAYYVINLTGAFLAALLAAAVTRRLSGSTARSPLIALAVVLAATALWGFTRPESHWPAWYAPALALVAIAGVLVRR